MSPLLLDVKVTLDAILERRPGAAAAVARWPEIERRRRPAVVPALGVTAIHYLPGGPGARPSPAPPRNGCSPFSAGRRWTRA